MTRILLLVLLPLILLPLQPPRATHTSSVSIPLRLTMTVKRYVSAFTKYLKLFHFVDFTVNLLYIHQVHQVPSKKSASEIPTPQFVVVDTYERDYSQTFDQPTSYLRARGGLLFLM